MSKDDFYEDPEQLLENWLDDYYKSHKSEWINNYNLVFIKKAFLDGYKAGFQAKKVFNWQEYNQK